MFTATIARKIVGIALILIVMMATTAIISTMLAARTSSLMTDLVVDYVPAYGDLARTNIRSLERALALRRMIIEKLRGQATNEAYKAAEQHFKDRGLEVEEEAAHARAKIGELIPRATSVENAALLGELDSQIEIAIGRTREELNREIDRLQQAMDQNDGKLIEEELTRIMQERNALNQELESVRSGMLRLVVARAEQIEHDQRIAIFVSVFLTILAAALGIALSVLVSGRMTRPVRRLLDSARAVAAGDLLPPLTVESSDEIGRLTLEFNKMIEQLKEKERLRETFGKYVDPRIVEGLLHRADLGREGQRRKMTVLFCDVKGFTSASEQLTPQGLVTIMNRYFSVMSESIHNHEGVIDKYIGDAIMAYWGAPFVQEADQMRLASLAAMEMRERLIPLRESFPELIGLRELPMLFDIRIGVATGEALVGSIGSDIMMSYTVMGDTVNLASRLEGLNKQYGSHVLVSAATAQGARDVVEMREIDLAVVLGQTKPQAIYEIMAGAGGLQPQQELLRGHYQAGLAAYRQRRWEEARIAFTAALEAVHDDGPSRILLERVEKFSADPPPADWDGAWHFSDK